MKDLFNSMRVFAPNANLVIADIEYQITSDFIKADLIKVEGDDTHPIYVPVNIKHGDFNRWLESKEYLEWVTNTSDIVTGHHIQESGKIGYVDFIQNELTPEIIHEYLFETGKTDLAFDKSAL